MITNNKLNRHFVLPGYIWPPGDITLECTLDKQIKTLYKTINVLYMYLTISFLTYSDIIRH